MFFCFVQRKQFHSSHMALVSEVLFTSKLLTTFDGGIKSKHVEFQLKFGDYCCFKFVT